MTRANRPRRLVLALACALALAACGSSEPQQSQGKLDSAPAADPAPVSQTPIERLVDEAPGSWGHLSFANDDGAYIEVTSADEICQFIDSSIISDLLGERDASIERLYGNESGEVLVFRLNGSSLGTEEEILAIIEEIQGNDIHTQFDLDDGTTVYAIAVRSQDGGTAMIFDGDASGLWVTFANAVDEASFDDVLERLPMRGTQSSLAESFSANSDEVMRVGNDEVGYVQVPNNWVPFTDLDPGVNSLQYTDGLGCVLTLESYPLEEGYTADEYALLIASNMLASDEENPDITSVEGSRADMAHGESAYVVETEWTDGTTMFVFLIGSGEQCYYVACEGSESAALDLAVRTIDTWEPAA